jgi:hypothetical protein
LTGPAPAAPSLSILDGAHNSGNPHFFFLPPLVPNPAAQGIARTDVAPAVEICEWAGSGCVLPLVARYTRASGPDGEVVAVDLVAGEYQVNWHSRDFGLDPNKTYRINVIALGQELGHADVDVVSSGSQLRNVQTGEYVGLVNGRTLPIKFRIEHGAIIERVVFTATRDGDEEIYVMDADGTNQTRLTADPGIDNAPVWSPDRTRIAFVSTRDGSHDIWVMNADGSGPAQLTMSPALDQLPAWSPDGTRIAFYSTRDGNHEIYVMNADGSGQVNISNSPGIDYWPRWSPDGSKLAFSSDRAGSQDIWVMNADGSLPVQLTTDPAIDYTPAWSPDGSRIAFSSERFGGVEEVMIMNSDGSSQTRLTASPTEDFYPAFSPDGLKILFSSNRFGAYDLLTMALDGSGLFRLTSNPGDDYAADWR